jgi:hypothetical protein
LSPQEQHTGSYVLRTRCLQNTGATYWKLRTRNAMPSAHRNNTLEATHYERDVLSPQEQHTGSYVLVTRCLQTTRAILEATHWERDALSRQEQQTGSYALGTRCLQPTGTTYWKLRATNAMFQPTGATYWKLRTRNAMSSAQRSNILEATYHERDVLSPKEQHTGSNVLRTRCLQPTGAT